MVAAEITEHFLDAHFSAVFVPVLVGKSRKTSATLPLLSMLPSSSLSLKPSVAFSGLLHFATLRRWNDAESDMAARWR